MARWHVPNFLGEKVGNYQNNKDTYDHTEHQVI